MLIVGAASDETDERGRPVMGDTLLLLVNNGDADQRFSLPSMEGTGVWLEVVNTVTASELHLAEEGCVTLAPYSLILLRYTAKRRRDATTKEAIG